MQFLLKNRHCIGGFFYRMFYNDVMARNQRAAITTSMILLIGGLIVELGIALAVVSYFLTQGGFGLKFSGEALMAARSGVQDALVRIIRDKNFNPSPNPYALSAGRGTAQVTVCKDTCAGTGKFQIDSLGSSFTKRRKIRAVVSVDSQTGEVKLESEKEISL